MKRWSQFLFILIAYGIALLHTAVPHQHGVATGTSLAISSPGILPAANDANLLQRVLATDLGCGHLETFKKGADIDVESSAAAAPLSILYSHFKLIVFSPPSIAASPAAYVEKLRKKLLLLSVSHFRAPPAL